MLLKQSNMFKSAVDLPAPQDAPRPASERISMMTAREGTQIDAHKVDGGPALGHASTQLKNSVSAVHVPFIQSRINEVKEDIEREKAKGDELQRKIDVLMKRSNEKTEETSWAELSKNAGHGEEKNKSGFSIIQVFLLALFFLFLGNKLAS